MLVPSLARALARARGQRGQTMAEYAVVLGVITFAIVAAIGVLQGSIIAALSDLQSRI
jgi:Flp pilus assembly pilin Flp